MTGYSNSGSPKKRRLKSRKRIVELTPSEDSSGKKKNWLTLPRTILILVPLVSAIVGVWFQYESRVREERKAIEESPALGAWVSSCTFFFDEPLGKHIQFKVLLANVGGSPASVKPLVGHSVYRPSNEPVTFFATGIRSVRLEENSEKYIRFAAMVSIPDDSLEINQFPDWLMDGTVGIDFLFDDITWEFAVPGGWTFSATPFDTDISATISPANDDGPRAVMYWAGQWDPGSRGLEVGKWDFEKFEQMIEE